MARKITLANSKGGIGKTTISSMLAYYLSTQGYKTLLIDLDPQANATTMIKNSFKDFKEKDYKTLYEGLKVKKIDHSINKITNNFDFIASSQDTTDFRELLNESTKYTYLKKMIQDIEGKYDFIFYDVPPTIFTDFINNSLVASDYFIILTETSDFSFSGISDMYDTAKKMSEVNNNLDFLGILINMREDDKEVLAELDEEYNLSNKEMFFQTYIPKRKRVVKYAKQGMFSRNNTSYIKYDRWDQELLNTFNNLTIELFNKMNESDNK